MSGKVLQLEVDADPQACPHVSWRAHHPSQLLLPDERVLELSVERPELETQEREANDTWLHCQSAGKSSVTFSK